MFIDSKIRKQRTKLFAKKNNWRKFWERIRFTFFWFRFAVKTTFPETKMRRTIRGFTILRERKSVWMINWEIERLIDWQIDWQLTDWLVTRLIGHTMLNCLIKSPLLCILIIISQPQKMFSVHLLSWLLKRLLEQRLLDRQLLKRRLLDQRRLLERRLLERRLLNSQQLNWRYRRSTFSSSGVEYSGAYKYPVRFTMWK